MQETDNVTQEILTDSDNLSYATTKSLTLQQFDQLELNDGVCEMQQKF